MTELIEDNIKRLKAWTLEDQRSFVINAIELEREFLESDAYSDQFESEIGEMHRDIVKIENANDESYIHDYVRNSPFIAESLSDCIG